MTWADRVRPVLRASNRIEALLLRRLGSSPMSLINRGDVLVLETIGRRTRRRRYAPVGYWANGEGELLVGGGAGGMTTIPDWVRNLRANPDAAVWVRRSHIAVHAHELTGAERDQAQQHAETIWSEVRRYALKSGRVIPYFRLVPTSAG